MKKASIIDSLAWGTDAGFYRLLPKYVFHPENENDIIKLIDFARKENKNITWRAAGTSLSGQAISNDIIAVIGKKWESFSIENNGEKIVLQPGVIGQRVNDILAPYARKFGPDPASIKSAMVGGIVSNNASGMSCGIHANSDKLLSSIRIILSDGTTLDTGSEASRKNFINSHKYFVDKIATIRDYIRSNSALYDLIKTKYSIKNVTGLNILPFIMYDDVFDIIAHLMVGSEGTLAFISEISMNTLPIMPYSASGLIYFTDYVGACNVVIETNKERVSAIELFDYKSLLAVKDSIDNFDSIPDTAMALLIKVEGNSEIELNDNIKYISNIVNKQSIVGEYLFTSEAEIVNKYWAIRSGIFPSVGSMRPIGTTCLIEDVAFPKQHLLKATAELQEILANHGYNDAVIYGHALEGNYHFILNQSFNTDQEIQRYKVLIDDVVKLVVSNYHGSLKAEHGTGRNMAPFVEYEWGKEAYDVMCEVKKLFDPDNIFNRGVIFNEDKNCHISNIKPLPRCHESIDRCIECGFCEVNCVTCGLSLSSRQRIVVQREISRLKMLGNEKKRLNTLLKEFKYLGNITCAGDGLCATSCPIGINGGELIHHIRETEIASNPIAQRIGSYSARNLSLIKASMRNGLEIVHAAHWVLGDKIMSSIANGLHYVSHRAIPLWTPAMPRASRKAKWQLKSRLKMVYFPSCINQTMGVDMHSKDKTPLMQKSINLIEKAGYEVIFPKNMSKLCCGMIWESKGMPEIADTKTKELHEALWEASNGGEYPIMCDQSPCLYRMRRTMKGLNLYEPVEFTLKYLAPHLDFTPIDETITVHTTCSTTKMGLQTELIKLAEMCARKVMVPKEVGCCGFAGDKGFTHPEVNRWALRKLRPQIEKNGITSGYSNSRTCEIGLTTNSGILFSNIIYLVDKATTPKK